jgi:DNA processing protein
MSAPPSACPECLRRGQLLAILAPYIERFITRPGAASLLCLANQDLAEAVATRAAAGILEQVEAASESSLRTSMDSAECWAVCRHDDAYPVSLRDAADAPWALIGRGDQGMLAELADPVGVVTVVGARRASAYGREVARTLGRDLAATGMVVVSGMAFGIDACAHRGALEAGRTVAVLGCGPDVAYPASHRSLWRRIQENGLVLSELPPGTGAWRWSFPARNRIIAGLAGITVVVEAAERSGVLGAARSAKRLGRALGAVPGPVNSRVSAGTNDLLADGAALIRNAEDVLNVPLRAEPALSAEEAPDPLQLSREAQAIIGEERVPFEVLSELVSTYGPAGEGEG